MKHEVYSNSLNSADDPSRSPTPSQRPSALLCAEIGHTMVNYGMSGGMSQDMAFASHSLPAAAADSEIWLLDMLTNDARLRGQNAVGTRWSKDFITATLINRLFSVKRTARFDATATDGAWSNTIVDVLGMNTRSAGAKKIFSVSGKAVAVCWLADYEPASQGLFEVKIDGTVVDTVNIAIPYGNTFLGLRYGHAARVYAVGEGQHTVEVKCLTSNTYAYLSYVAGSGDQPYMPRAFIGTGMKCPGSSVASGVPAAFVSANRQMVLDHVAFLKSLSLPVEAVDTAAAVIDLLPDGVHETVAGAVQMKNIMAEVRRQPQRLTWPVEGGGQFFVDLNKYGRCTGYGQL